MNRTVLALMVMSCSSLIPQVVPEAKGEFKATGAVQLGALGASFDSARVVSPSITLSRRTDGSWGGRFAQAGSGDSQAIDVSVSESAARGVDFVMTRESPEPGHTVLVGAFRGKNFRFELTKDGLSAHTTRHSADYFGRRELPDGSAQFGDMGSLLLKGEAAKTDSFAWPQMAFALLAAFY